ncbi:DNRLRE domain-containing protein [Streptomyces sp. NPDC059863]|uniref:golvesin C-terminal-like domain-containing protein n=1 Tax=unclassified Streptomyces TaxID=2593676 RepID=UPI0036659FD0
MAFSGPAEAAAPFNEREWRENLSNWEKGEGDPPVLSSESVPLNERVPKGGNARKPERVKEFTERRTPTARYWQMSDGNTQAEISAVPTAFRSGAGWKTIDTSVTAADRKGFTYANTANTARSWFGSDAASLLRVETASGQGVTFGLKGAGRLTPRAKGSDVSYPGAVDGADLAYRVGPGEVKETLTLKERPANAPAYTFTLDTDGLTPKLRPGGSVAFHKESAADPVLVIPAPYMTDAKRDADSPYGTAYSTDVTTRLAKKGGGWELTVEPSAAWLNAPERQYPVVIDPTITIAPTPTQSQDVMVTSDDPGANFKDSWRLSAGRTTVGNTRSLIKYDLSGIPARTRIDSARMQLYYDQNHSANNLPVTLGAYRATGPWDETTATWNSTKDLVGEQSAYSVTVDDGDAGTTAAKGAWPSSTNTAFTQYAINRDYLYNKDAVTGDTYTWQPQLAESGAYRVDVHSVPATDRATNAPYTLTHNGGTTAYTVDQSAGTGGVWKTLGTKDFAAGTAGKLVLGDGPASTSTAVVADAARFVKPATDVMQPNTYNKWHSFSVRDTVQSWLDGTQTNHGFVVKAENEATAAVGGPRYHASRYGYGGETATYPKLTLTYGRPGADLKAPTTIHDTGAELAWGAYQDPSTGTADDIVEYQVHRSVFQRFTPSASTLIAPVSKDARTFTDTTAAPTAATDPEPFGRAYYYMVAVKTADGQIVPATTQLVRLPKAGRTTKIFQSGQSDTTLSSNEPTTPHDTISDTGVQQNWLSVGNNSATFGKTRAVLGFPSLNIPASARVMQSELVLWGSLTNTGGSGAVYELRPLTRSFDEATATWNKADAATAWTTPGGDHAASVSDTVSQLTNDPARHNWDATSLTQGWVRDPASAKGLMVKLADEAGPQERTLFLSSEAPEQELRPQLVVTYIDSTTASTYYAAGTPARMIPGDTHTVEVTLTNTTGRVLSAANEELTYTWALPDGTDATTGGNQVGTALPRDLPPGDTVTVQAQVKAPVNSGSGNKRTDHVLTWDVRNKSAGTWMSATDSIAGLRQNVAVEDPTSNQLGMEKFYSYTGKNTGAGASVMNNLFAGNNVWSYNAFTNPGRGISTFARFTYNSLDTSDTVLGHGWSAQLASPLRLGMGLDFHPNPSPREVTLPDGDGTAHIFRKQDDGTWKAPAGVHYLLKEKPGVDCKPSSDGDPEAWSLTRPDRTVFFFDCDGFITSTVDKNGNTQSFTYEERKSNNKPVKFLRYITDPAGRQTLTVDYYAKGEAYSYIDDAGAKVTGDNLTNPKIVDHVKSIRDVDDRELTFVYSDKGLLGELTDGAGSAQPKVFRFVYDATQGNKNVKLVKVTDPRGNATSFDYYSPNEGDDPKFHWASQSITDRLGGTTGFVYTDPDGSAGSVIDTRVTDAEGHTTDYVHDGFGRPTRITNAKSQVTEVSWDADNNVTRLEEPNGAFTTWVYDPKTGYPLEQKDPEANKNGTPAQTFQYQTGLNGHIADLWRKTSPEGRTWEFGYDASGNLTAVTDPKGVASATVGDYTTRYEYDAMGQLTKETDANGNSTTNSGFGPTGYPATITDPLGKSATFVYDVRGNVLEAVNAKGAKVTQTYDDFGRPLVKKEPKDQGANLFITTPAPVYDANDNITRVTAPNGAVSTSAYDKGDQLIERVLPRDEAGDPERTSTFTYDKAGNVLTETEPQGNVTTETGDFTTTNRYDEIYQAVETVNSQGEKATATYDNVGNVLKVVDPLKNAGTDPDAFTTKFTYDLNHRVVTTTDAIGATTTDRFDLDGNTIGTTDAEGNEALAAYDARNALIEAKQPWNKDSSGNPLYRTTQYEYDQVGNSTKTVTPRGVETTDDTTDFVAETVYDQLNRVKEERSPFDKDDARYRTPDTTFYNYDEVGNLFQVSTPPSEGQSVRNVTEYAYYDNGWTKSSKDPWDITTSYDYNELGQQTKNTLTAAGGSQSRTMTWDFYPSGNERGRSDDGVPVGRAVTLVDSSDFHNTTSQGTWNRTTAPGNYGYDTYSHPAGTGTGQFVWQLNIPQKGNYEVFVRHPQVTGAATDATFTIDHDGGSATKSVDQSARAGEWISLGSYAFVEDGPQKISVSDKANGTVLADAVKLVRDNGGESDTEKKDFGYRYDVNGNLVEVKDNSPGAAVDTYRVGYDGLNRISKVQEFAGGTVKNTTALTYNANGNPVTSTHDVTWSKTEYDARDLVTKVTNADSATAGDQQISTFTYTPLGQSLRQTKPNGNTLDLSYYLDGSVKRSQEKTAAGAVVAQHDLEYSANGHRSKDTLKLMNADDPAASIDNTYLFDYDPQDRVAKVTKSGDSSATETYTYDANSNVIEQSAGGVDTTHRYDRNRLLSSSAGGISSTFNYDPLGRLDTISAGGQTIQKNTYDGFDRTKRSRSGAGASAVTTDYVHDPFDRTVSETTSGAESRTRTFTYLGMDDQVLREELSGKADKSYQLSPWGQKLTQIKHLDTGSKEYSQFTYSPRGDVEAITKDNGTTRATYGYTAYGSNDDAQFTGADKPDASAPEGEEPYNAFRYNAARWDGGSGTYDMGFRNYDPGLNRFLTRDMYGGALADMRLAADPFTGNRYAFAGGNPISFVEIDGHLFGLSLSDIGHATLDVVGLVPVVGEVADVANGVWYAAEGNYTDAALSMASAIPFAGYGATAVKAGRYVDKGLDALDTASDTVRAADNVGDAAKAAPTPKDPSPAPAPKQDAPDAPAAPACKINSFVPGTAVLMADGSTRAIDRLEVGDLVLATDVEGGDTRARAVTDTRSHEGRKDLVTLTVDTDGRDGAKSGTITSTAGHEYWLPDAGRWVQARALEPGMWLRASSGTWIQVTAVDRTTRKERVHNLTVEGVHDYYVLAGDGQLLVHNGCGDDLPEIKIPKSLRGGDGIFSPGPFARKAVLAPSTSQRFGKAVRKAVNAIGDRFGCHRCGVKDPGTSVSNAQRMFKNRTLGNWIPDHWPANAVLKKLQLLGKARQLLLPHCKACSNIQRNAMNQHSRS